jgi:hypothetical protein
VTIGVNHGPVIGPKAKVHRRTIPGPVTAPGNFAKTDLFAKVFELVGKQGANGALLHNRISNPWGDPRLCRGIFYWSFTKTGKIAIFEAPDKDFWNSPHAHHAGFRLGFDYQALGLSNFHN